MTQHIDRMKEGDQSLKITALGGDIIYEGNGQFQLRDPDTKEMRPKQLKRIGMIAAGSGIAPMYQLAQTVGDLRNDLTSLSLIYSNRTPVSLSRSPSSST